MKTLLIIALAMSMTLTGYAEPTNELAVLSKVSLIEQKARITLLEGLNRVKIYVKDANGRTLYCTSRKVHKTMVMPICMEKLPIGKYVIRIETKESKIDYDVETMAKKEIEPRFKANVKALDDRFVKVSLYELQEEGPVSVRVYDYAHRLIHHDRVDGGPFARKYEFKNISTKGSYLSISDRKGNSQTYYL